MSASIRDAGVADLPGILAIYNDAVGNTTAIWNETPVDLANRQAWFDTRARQGYPILGQATPPAKCSATPPTATGDPSRASAAPSNTPSTCATTSAAKASACNCCRR